MTNNCILPSQSPLPEMWLAMAARIENSRFSSGSHWPTLSISVFSPLAFRSAGYLSSSEAAFARSLICSKILKS
ncbi:MAG: hypothetical protein IIA35_08115 [Proteobacteria bacterium]|nr:hypothetical protein [Pseudomonadota bacterium]